MLAQSKDAQSLLKTVIAGYNSKLADRASQLEANNTGVSLPPHILFSGWLNT